MLEKIMVGGKTLTVGKGPEDMHSGYIGRNLFSTKGRPDNTNLGEHNSLFDSSADEDTEDEDTEADYGDDVGDNDGEIGKYDDGFFRLENEGVVDADSLEECCGDLLMEFDDFP